MKCFQPILNWKMPLNGNIYYFNKFNTKPGMFENSKLPNHHLITNKFVQYGLPCKTCSACRMNKRAEWRFRLQKEVKYSKTNNLFVTLTYNEQSIKYNNIIDIETNKRRKQSVLQYKDFQLFMKRLRERQTRIKNYDKTKKLKYFVCSEYGKKNGRIHFHAILINCQLDDLKLWNQKKQEFTSQIISNAWNNGFVNIKRLNDNNIDYVLKYLLKNEYDRKENQQVFNDINKERYWLKRRIKAFEDKQNDQKRLSVKKQIKEGYLYAYELKKQKSYNYQSQIKNYTIKDYENDQKRLSYLQKNYIKKSIFKSSKRLGIQWFINYLKSGAIERDQRPTYRINGRIYHSKLPFYFEYLLNQIKPDTYEKYKIRKHDKLISFIKQDIKTKNDQKLSFSAELDAQALLISKLTNTQYIPVKIEDWRPYKAYYDLKGNRLLRPPAGVKQK